MKADLTKEDPKQLILDFFASEPQQAFTDVDLEQLYDERRRSWNINRHTSIGYLYEVIEENKLLKKTDLTERRIRLWISPKATIYDIAGKIQDELIFSHGSAAFLHGLLDTPTKDIYLTERKKSDSRAKENTLTQEAIDRAMQKHQRVSQNLIEYNDYQIHIITSKLPYSLPAETIIKNERQFTVTSIEQTLIDIIVRPAYCQNPQTILKTYEQAKDKADPAKMIAAYKKMQYIYPYHQVMGFYMQKAGYDTKDYQPLTMMPKEFDFYVDYQLDDTHYDSQWRLYYPASL
ncbi:MAG: hypothetical protein V4450_17405 [Bacteroidota bacterium]